MAVHLRGLLTGAFFLATGGLLLLTDPLARAGEKDEMVENPYYKFWAPFKKGATVTHLEKTKLAGPDSVLVPDGVEQKVIAYKLLDVNDKRAHVEAIVTEREFFGTV